MQVTNVGVVNHSSTPDTEIAKWAAAAEKQMRDDVAPAWHIPAPQLRLVAPNTNPPDIDSWIAVFDDREQRIGLGYHELYYGKPIGYVLVEYTKSYNQTPSRVFSHEVLEMAINPNMERKTPPIGGIEYLVEAGDILSFDEGGYWIDGVLVSGFATPAYFHLEAGSVYAIKNNLPGPLPAAAPPGMGTILCWRGATGLQTAFPAPISPLPEFMEHPHTGSRRFRRNMPRAEWRDRIIPPSVPGPSSQSGPAAQSGNSNANAATSNNSPPPPDVTATPNDAQPNGTPPRPTPTVEPSWAKPGIAIFALAIFACALVVVWSGGGVMKDAFNLLIGAVIANATTVFGYYFGSSSGSAQKTALLASTTTPSSGG
jgi:hypothetical protein